MKRAALTLVILGLSSSAHADLRKAGMRRALRELGDAKPELMDQALEAALDIETRGDIPGLDAPMILAIAWAESRFEPGVGHLCGVMQVSPKSMGLPHSVCPRWRVSVRAGMEAGIQHLRMLLDDVRRVRGDLDRALEYRACGGKAFTKACLKRPWLGRVKKIADRLRAPQFRMEARDA